MTKRDAVATGKGTAARPRRARGHSHALATATPTLFFPRSRALFTAAQGPLHVVRSTTLHATQSVALYAQRVGTLRLRLLSAPEGAFHGRKAAFSCSVKNCFLRNALRCVKQRLCRREERLEGPWAKMGSFLLNRREESDAHEMPCKVMFPAGEVVLKPVALQPEFPRIYHYERDQVLKQLGKP